MEDELARRKSLTFEQAERADPLPSQLKLKEVSAELRAKLYEFIDAQLAWENITSFEILLDEPWHGVFYRYWVDKLHRRSSDFDGSRAAVRRLQHQIFDGNYLVIFGFLQWVLRLRNSPLRGPKLNGILTDCRAAYRVVENTIMPVGSEAEIAAIRAALEDTASSQFAGSRAHLRNAGEQLTAGEYSDSIRESIHAVEAAAKALEPSASTLGDALHTLEKKVKIHSALKAGFLKIYGFTSDENGIRHALIDKPEAAVDETDALFMIGACASFISYLINRGRAAGLISPST